MEKTTKLLRVKKVGGSWDIRLPRAFVRINGLRDGDYMIVDMSALKIIRAEELETAGRVPVMEVAE